MTANTTSVISPFANLQIDELRRRSSAKWQFYPDDVLPVWVAEMDAYVAQPIVDAVHQALLLGDTGYPWGPRLQNAVASFAADRWGWTFDPAQAITVTDVMTGVIESVRTLSKPGDPIILTPPIYPPFSMVTAMLERPMIPAQLSEHGRLDLDRLETAFKTAAESSGTPILLLSNPHNPTGTVHTREELEQVARLARQYGARVVSDEIHATLIMPTSTFTPYLSVAGTEPDVSLISASKGWNLAGFKAALAIPGTDSVEALQTINHRMGTHPGHIAVIAHSTAFDQARDWLDGAIAGIDINRQLLGEQLAQRLPNARYTPPEATYLAWIDCRELGLGDDPAKVFLDLGRVGFSSGVPFGEGGQGHVRFNLATAPAIVTEAVERMANAVAKHASDAS
ncbi:MAG: aminotransferase class I/II-fold pyridoxal phosphate-dependent enzyme [Thermomicrobiales bacterium]|nr:aminotransferase class I/II-fold pyridoxal phosphate-dependent enzyme [Thermomicrobiales bacterium]MCO5223107.1 aminotransferase class I/II-fold pyridoxal phosphate-dependent enzyme [Thermomicrobiales bacterium]